MMKPTQKFVAGAVCPACEGQDSVLIDSLDQSIECVDCGFTQTPQQRDAELQQNETSKKPKYRNAEINILQIDDNN